MKRTVLAMLLVAAITAVAQTAPAPAQSAAPAAAPQQKKEIKDPAEYNAYVGAVQQKDRQPRSAAWKHFSPSIPTA